MKKKHLKIFKWAIIFTILLIAIYIYKIYNPYEVNFYPACPFRTLTGYKCPGCGSQRAIHFILNLDFKNALKENLLFIIAIPYIFISFFFDNFNIDKEWFRKGQKLFTGNTAIKVIIAIILIFWISRNIWNF